MNSTYGKDNSNKNIENLDYTIDLDGKQYNLTAADSLWADIARRVENALKVTLSTKQNDSNEIVNYDGDESRAISVVPSTGGVFTGPISIPNLQNDQDKSFAINLDALEKLIKNLDGFPTYIWIEKPDGSGEGELRAMEDDPEFSPFKVVLYESSTDNPAGIKFEIAENTYTHCYFFAINLNTGWLSLGEAKADGSDTTYIDLRVNAADNANNSMNAVNATYILDDSIDENQDKTTYNFDDIADMDQRLADIEDQFDVNNADSLIKLVQIINNSINKHLTELPNHRQIVYGFGDSNNDGAVTDDAFSADGQYKDKDNKTINVVPQIGDIYIKLESN